MGRLLIDVLTLDKEGLVGFTEDGEKVPLSSPEIKLLKREVSKSAIGSLSSKELEDYLDVKYNLESQNILMEEKKDKYIQFSGNWSFCIAWIVIPYNVYTRRE